MTVKPWVGPADPGLGRPGRLTTWLKERGKRQSEFGMEMQSNEEWGRNDDLDSPEAGGNGSLLIQSTPGIRVINHCLWVRGAGPPAAGPDPVGAVAVSGAVGPDHVSGGC